MSESIMQVGPDEKSQALMIYTVSALCWGDVIVKEVIRVSTWLRTNSAPDYMRLYNAKMLYPSAGSARPQGFPALFMTVPQVLGYHLIPPARDPLDYDPTEPNRKLEPVTLVLGTFRIDGCIRMATASNLSHFLDINREAFTSIYDAEISNPLLPNMGVMKVPYMQVRQTAALFSPRV